MSIPALFAAQVARTPEAMAVTFEGASMTYQELDEASNRLAHLLADQGVGPGSMWRCCFPRSAEAIVAMLAVLKTGAAYVPIDPAVPEARMRVHALRCRADRRDHHHRAGSPGWTGTIWRSSISGTSALSRGGNLAPHCRGRSRRHRLHHLHLGHHRVPKGVAITHRNVTRLLESYMRRRVGRGQVWTQWHSLAFDVSVCEIWGALLGGGRLVVVPESVARSPRGFPCVTGR